MYECLLTCMYVYCVCAYSLRRPELLELELATVVSQNVGAGN